MCETDEREVLIDEIYDLDQAMVKAVLTIVKQAQSIGVRDLTLNRIESLERQIADLRKNQQTNFNAIRRHLGVENRLPIEVAGQDFLDNLSNLE